MPARDESREASPGESPGAFRDAFRRLRDEIGRAVVGQAEVVDGVLTALFAGGHCLLEGVPGLGKTLLARALARALDLRYARIQFTPDLMPADILGTSILREDGRGGRELAFQPGPVFTQLLLADEINRATPKTQSALLEAMQERAVTAGGSTRPLEEPFFVVATQNPIEMEGTYPLPEAQLDRFLFKLAVGFPSRAELADIALAARRPDDEILAGLRPVMDAAAVNRWRAYARGALVAPEVADYAVRLTLATHPDGEFAAPTAKRFVRCGASPRATRGLIAAAKVRALLDGRFNVATEDVALLAPPVLRHRILLNFEGEAEGLGTEPVVRDALRSVGAT